MKTRLDSCLSLSSSESPDYRLDTTPVSLCPLKSFILFHSVLEPLLPFQAHAYPLTTVCLFHTLLVKRHVCFSRQQFCLHHN